MILVFISLCNPWQKSEDVHFPAKLFFLSQVAGKSKKTQLKQHMTSFSCKYCIKITNVGSQKSPELSLRSTNVCSTKNTVTWKQIVSYEFN